MQYLCFLRILQTKDFGKMSEQELAEGCKKGDNRARKELYELFAQPMLCLCFRYVADLEQAQDLLHDGFLKVFSSISSYNLPGRRQPAGMDESGIYQSGVGLSASQ